MGQKFQGDICFFKLDKRKKLSSIAARIDKDGHNMIIQEGEMTGHHHMIQPVMFRDDGLARELESQVISKASLFSDPDLLNKLVKEGTITDKNLCIGFLKVTGKPAKVEHQEHDPVMLDEGLYYVGRQRESQDGLQRNRVVWD